VVVGYHIAWLLQAFPSGSRVTHFGHSHGGYAVLSALHLLGGGSLDDGTEPCRPSIRSEGPSLRLRAVVIASASDRQWLDPGERLGKALQASEDVLCLYNKLDPLLVAHPFGKDSDHKRALGKTGMSRVEEEWLSPIATRYCERGIGSLLGPRHTFRGATANPTIAGMIGPYLWPDECSKASLSSPRKPATPSSRH
jgi:hypothetical protein